MTESWEIVAGDFGGSYKAIVKGLDLSSCTAKIKVWKGSPPLIDGKVCTSVIYDESADESYCYYEVKDEDIPLSAAIDGKTTEYNVMIEFTKTGFKEHDLGFKWTVFAAPPSGGS